MTYKHRFRIYLQSGFKADKLAHLVFMIAEKIKINQKSRKSISEIVNLTKEQKREIDKLYKENYGKKISYKWHRYYTAYTGNFDKNYIPELLYIPEFERFENIKVEYAKAIEDKNFLPLIVNSLPEVVMPKSYLSCTSGIYRNEQNQIISKQKAIETLYNLGECFYKPSLDSSSGKNCKVIKLCNGIDELSGENIEKLLSNNCNFTIQERIVCHESIRKIYPNAVNTFRIMTYRWKDEIISVPVIMRIGQGGANIDNAHGGDVYCIRQ